MSRYPRARPVIEDFGYARTRPTLSSTAKLLSALNLDGPLLVGLGFLALYGLAILYSASGQSIDTVLRTLVRIALGTAATLAQPWHRALPTLGNHETGGADAGSLVSA